MEAKEIYAVLKKAANMEPYIEDGEVYGFGAINRCPECKNMTEREYRQEHHPAMSKLLESLPWEKVVERPRNPRNDEYPQEDGTYITMLDCNEHEVLVNRFRDGRWSLYDETHVKWWMKLPKMDKEECEDEKENPTGQYLDAGKVSAEDILNVSKRMSEIVKGI